jgi:hypothetical protein
MWIYRALFFAWASWMAFALVRWLRWAFNAWKTGGCGDDGAGPGNRENFDSGRAVVRTGKRFPVSRPGTAPTRRAFEVALRGRRQALEREFAGLRFVDDLFQRAAHEDVAHLGIMLALRASLFSTVKPREILSL